MAEPKPRAERRRATRILVDFPAKLIWGRKQFQCKAREFSEFGILLTSKNKDLVGKDVELNLNWDSAGSPVALKGVVAYATDTGLGVRFKNTSSEERTVLRHYIHAHNTPTKSNRVGT